MPNMDRRKKNAFEPYEQEEKMRKSKLCHVNSIRIRLNQVDGQIEEYIEYQNGKLMDICEEFEFSEEQKKEIKKLLLENYIKKYDLPF